jgi:hypothetical protein
MYSVPFGGFNVAGSLQYRQGYPFVQLYTVTGRGLGLGNQTYLLHPMGENRHPNVKMIDFRVDRPFLLGKVRFIQSVDVFNLTNENTVLARNRNQYTYNHSTGVGSSPANANTISGIIAPRILRFGIRATW